MASSVDSDKARKEMAQHLRWCASCRSGVADYRWLQGEITSTLQAVVDATPVPPSNWPGVQQLLSVGQRRSLLRQRLSGALSAGLVICLVFVASPVLEAAWGAGAMAVQVLPVRPPVLVSVSGEPRPPAITSTPACSLDHEAGPTVIQSQMVRPTPPAPEPVQRPHRLETGPASGV